MTGTRRLWLFSFRGAPSAVRWPRLPALGQYQGTAVPSSLNSEKEEGRQLMSPLLKTREDSLWCWNCGYCLIREAALGAAGVDCCDNVVIRKPTLHGRIGVRGPCLS